MSLWMIHIRLKTYGSIPEGRTELYRDELFTMTYLNRDIRVQKIEPSFIEMNYSQWHIWIETYGSIFRTCMNSIQICHCEWIHLDKARFISSGHMSYSNMSLWIIHLDRSSSSIYQDRCLIQICHMWIIHLDKAPGSR